MELSGAVGILTGASRGIGAILAEELARRGVHLALAARSEAALEETAARVRAFGVRAATIPSDVTKRSDLKALVTRAGEELGPIDLVVNNAGIERYDRFEEVEPDVIEEMVRTNLIGAMLLSRYALPGMVERRRGHIVNMSSAAGKTAVPYNTTYGATKHALIGFSWSLREEMRPYGVGVSVICPGFVRDTGMAAWIGGDELPVIAGSVAPEKVVAATIRAIERNQSEVVVSGGLGKVADVFMAISPETSTWVARRGGFYDFLRRSAERRR